MAEPIDVDKVIPEQSVSNVVSTKIEDSRVVEARQRREDLDGWFHRLTNFLVFLSLLGLVGVAIFDICLPIIKDPQSPAEDKKWATSTITLIVSGGIGYLTGRASTNKTTSS